jgi:hypothetical protein
LPLAEQKLVKFRTGLESERAAFYANLEREKREFEALKQTQQEEVRFFIFENKIKLKLVKHTPDVIFGLSKWPWDQDQF